MIYIYAFAASNSQSGTYKQNAYRLYVSCSDTTVYASMSWSGTQYKVMAKAQVSYLNRTTGSWLGGSMRSSNQQLKFASISVTVPYGAVAEYGCGYGLINDIYFVNGIYAYPGR